MGFRLLVLTEDAKLNFHSGYLVVHREQSIVRILAEEIDTIILENPQITISGILINKLIENNIVLILCDDRHLPLTLFSNLYANYRRTASIKTQIKWNQSQMDSTWKYLIQQKIRAQRQVAEVFSQKEDVLLRSYEVDVQLNDVTNREGMAAKVFFSRVYGNTFKRHAEDTTNWALNYGYTILLSYFTRTIIAKGYLTEIGIHHKNEYNQFNLSSDFMEPFRPIIDYIVKTQITDTFGTNERRILQQIHDLKIKIDGRLQYVPQAIDIFCQNIFMTLSGDAINELRNIDISPIFSYEF